MMPGLMTSSACSCRLLMIPILKLELESDALSIKTLARHQRNYCRLGWAEENPCGTWRLHPATTDLCVRFQSKAFATRVDRLLPKRHSLTTRRSFFPLSRATRNLLQIALMQYNHVAAGRAHADEIEVAISSPDNSRRQHIMWLRLRFFFLGAGNDSVQEPPKILTYLKHQIWISAFAEILCLLTHGQNISQFAKHLAYGTVHPNKVTSTDFILDYSQDAAAYPCLLFIRGPPDEINIAAYSGTLPPTAHDAVQVAFPPSPGRRRRFAWWATRVCFPKLNNRA